MSKRTFSLYDEEDDDIPPKKLELNNYADVQNSKIIADIAGETFSEKQLHNQHSSNTINRKEKGYFLSVVAWRKGEREEMQDRHLIVDRLLADLCDDIESSSLFALFDGHGGKMASEFCAKHFSEKFRLTCLKYMPANKDLIMFEKNMKKIFIDTYKNIDDGFMKEARANKPLPLKDGTTATTLFLLNKVLYCANIGDSKAVVCRRKAETEDISSIQITVDHSPLSFEERTRILKSGGSVKDGRVIGVLEVSRSIGDFQYKAHGVICIPDLKKLTLTPDDWFVILACDGLWKKFSADEAVKFASQVYKKEVDKHKQSDEQAWLKAADELAAESVKRGCGDNVSIIIIVF